MGNKVDMREENNPKHVSKEEVRIIIIVIGWESIDKLKLQVFWMFSVDLRGIEGIVFWGCENSILNETGFKFRGEDWIEGNTESWKERRTMLHHQLRDIKY